VYGAENVTSGASSDLQHATRTARAMVKVHDRFVFWMYFSACPDLVLFLAHQAYGYSSKIGPVAFTDRDEVISPQKLDEIEAEVRGYVSPA
jgi:ATP-dependent metalloprotease